MISNRPYLIRAIYDWIVDNGWTPHFQLDANYPGVVVPRQYVQEGMIVLNAAPTAVVGLAMENEQFGFSARFQGQEQSIYFPPQAVLAVFARENGQGMPFPPEPYPEEGSEAHSAAPKQGLKALQPSGSSGHQKDNKAKKRPTLSVVK